MKFFNKIEQTYQQYWKLIIRPHRNTYPSGELGPQVFFLEGKQIQRVDISLTNPRGLLFQCSHFIPLGKNSYPCVIYMHGNSSNRTEGIEYLHELINQGISLFTFDFSGCGNSQGEFISLGWYQWEDLAQVIKYLKKKQTVSNIALWGRSMGAVTALQYLKKQQAIGKQIIKAAVFDSPFKSLKVLIEDLCKKNSKIPMIILAAIMKFLSNTIQQKAKFDIYKLNPIENVNHIKTPGFFVVAKDDELVNSSHTKQIYDRYGGKKILKEIAGTHNSNRPQSTIEQVITFLKKHLNSQNEQINIQINEQKKQQKKQEKHDFFDQRYNAEKDYEDQEEDVGQANLDFFNMDENELKSTEFKLSSLINNLNPFDFTNKIQDSYVDLKKQLKKNYEIQNSKLVQSYLKKQTDKLKKIEKEVREVRDDSFKRQLQDNYQSWCFHSS